MNAHAIRFALATLIVSLLPLSIQAQEFSGEKLKGSLWGVAAGGDFTAAVGPGGTVALSKDDQTWSARPIQSGPLLLSADIAGGDTIIAVGGKGGFVGGKAVVLRSTDRGETFQTVSSGVGGTLYEIRFFTPRLGFAGGTGGTLLKSSDVGATWKSIKTGTPLKIWAIHFFDAYHGLIGGGDTPWQNDGKKSGLIRRTADGGRTWATAYEGPNRISDFSFIDARTGYAGGVGGQLLKTRDGGRSWKSVGPTPLKAIINAIAFATEACGLIVGAGGTAYMTRDGGKTWPVKIPVTKGSFLEDLDAAGAPGSKPRTYWVAGGDGTIGRINLGDACA